MLIRLTAALCAGLLTLKVCEAQDVTGDRRFNSVAWTQNAAEYERAARQAYTLARIQLDRGLKDHNWSADEVQSQAGEFSTKSPAVILDVDETVLDNSAYNARGILDGTQFSGASWVRWSKEEKARAVPGSLEFIRYAISNRVQVYYVTNRTDEIKEVTINNLKKLGFPADAAHVLTRNDDDQRGGDKVSRRAMVAENHRIILLIGDNMADLCAGMRNVSTATRNATAAAVAKELGDRWILLPNPTYGGWERAIGSPSDALRTDRHETPAGDATEIRVGSWNIEHLGAAGERYEPATNKAQKVEDLVDKFTELNCDVIALQEIYVTSSNSWSNSTLTGVVRTMNQRRGQNWRYELFRNRRYQDRSQVTGIMWNRDRLTRVSDLVRIDIDDDTDEFNEWDRHPYAVKFSVAEGKTDFVVIPLHMKAGSDDNVTQRRNEARMLIQQLPELRSSLKDEDFILIGDTNVTSVDEATSQDIQRAGFRDLFPGSPSTVTWGFRTFDRVFVAAASPEFQDSEQQIYTVPESQSEVFRINLSDHFPIVTTIQVTVDDD